MEAAFLLHFINFSAFTIFMKKYLLLVAVLLFSFDSFAVSIWQKKDNHAYIIADGHGPDGVVTTVLDINCKKSSMKNTLGTFGLEYKIFNLNKIKHFNFSKFEGPTPLVRSINSIQIISLRGKRQFKFKTDGFYTDDDSLGITGDCFVFSLHKIVNTKNELSRFIKEITRGIVKVIFTAEDSSENTKKIITTTFSGSNAAETVAAVMQGCTEL